MEHHPHDKKWIKDQLKKVPGKDLKKVIEGYSKVYLETGNRRTVNTRLREYIENVEKRGAT
jgi:hypothetical protein